MSHGETVLEVTDLRRVFAGRRGEPDRVAVERLSFSLQAGGGLAIVGDSGSGKTTTLRMVALTAPLRVRSWRAGVDARVVPGTRRAAPPRA